MTVTEPTDLAPARTLDVDDLLLDAERRSDFLRSERRASARLDLVELINEAVARADVTSPSEISETRQGPTASVFYGAAGVGLAMAELAARTGRPEWLIVARAWAETAARSTDRDAYYAEGCFGPRQRPDDRSFHHGPAGAHLTVAKCAALQGDLAGLTRAVDDVAQLVGDLTHETPTDSTIDAVVGPVSLLTGLCGLVETIQAAPCAAHPSAHSDGVERVLDVLASLISNGVERLDASIVTRPIRGNTRTNLGAAHGWTGLLDTVMRSASVTGTEPPNWVDDRADELFSFAETRDGRAFWPVAAGHPVARSGGWCNGSAGHISMLCRRYERSGDQRHLDLARHAAAAAADEPSPVHNLCCGSAGKALATLTLFRTTGERAWLQAAEDFLSEAIELRGAQTAVMLQLERNPRSVYKGDLGVAVAAAALIDPDRPVRFFH